MDWRARLPYRAMKAWSASDLGLQSEASLHGVYTPTELTLEITRKCPLRCILCSSDGGDSYESELGLSEWKRIIEEASALGTRTLIFSGGEPFVSPWLLPLCKHARKRSMDVCVYTSGNTENRGVRSLEERTLITLREYGVKKLIFSLHGPSAIAHESTTRVSGSFHNTLASIRVSIELGFNVEIHFVPTRFNYRYLPDIVTLAEKLHVARVSILRFVAQGRGRINRSLLDLTADQLTELKSLFGRARQTKSLDVRIGAPFSALLLDECARCSAGLSRATIRSDGMVYPCEALKNLPNYQGSSLVNRTLKWIWQNDFAFEQARQSAALVAKSRCIQCDVFAICRGGCPAQRIASGHSILDSPDPICRQLPRMVISAD
jgi:radical SAM protein with 4Fe4S-binding SPASM domain